MSRILFFIITISLFLFACKKDSESFIQEETTISAFISTDLAGIILDEQNQPISQAIIRIATDNGPLIIETDADGLFFVHDVSIRQDQAYFSVEKEGYFHGSKVIFATPNSVNHLKINLLEKAIIGVVDASTGGIVETAEGAIIELPANGIRDENGNTYNGSVQVAAKWLNPDAPNLIDIMPGNLQGLDEENNRVALATGGMLAVELFGENNQQLNIQNNAEAILTFPLLTNSNIYPAVIPLWYFDESNGVWVKEGQADLVDGKYVGKVSHFSFWNCDDEFELVTANGKIIDSNGQPLPNAKVNIRLEGTMLTGGGQTDQNGCFLGQIPKNQNLTIEVLNNCYEIVNSINVGPFLVDVNLAPIEVNTLAVPSIQLTGQLIDCNGLGLANGLVRVRSSDNLTYIATNSDGFYATTLLDCQQDSVFIQGYDPNNTLESVEMAFLASENLDADELLVCDILPEFIKFNLNGEEYTVVEPSAVSSGVVQGITQIYSDDDVVPFAAIYFSSNDLNVSIPVSQIQFTTPTGVYTNSMVNVVLTEYGAVGELIIGSFSGAVLDSDDIAYDVSGTFSVILNQ